MYISESTKIAGAGTAGGVVGAVQTMLLREFADISMAKSFLTNTSGTPPLLMKQLKGFGSPSALAGIIGGAAGLAIGLASALKGAVTRNGSIAAGFMSYGAVALVTGVISGAYPTAEWSAGIATDPNNPVGPGNAVVIRNSGAAASPVQRMKVLAA